MQSPESESSASFTSKTLPAGRIATSDIGQVGLTKHHVKALLELDVTEARRKILARKPERVSFTAWLVKCIGQTVSEHKDLHGVRKGRRGLVVFDDVDVTVIVEKQVRGDKVPVPHVIRKTNAKSVSEIQHDIEHAQESPGGAAPGYMKAYEYLPAFCRRWGWRYLIGNPSITKKTMGTVLVTSVGMFAKVAGWVIPVGVMPLQLAVGSIVRKPGVVEDRIEIREYLYVTVLVDHDVIDGAPAMRALARLASLVESGWGLSDSSSPEAP